METPEIKKQKRKKYPKLPNGFGQIKYLGDGRRNPFAAHPPAKQNPITKRYDTPRPLGYFSTYMDAFAALSVWHDTIGKEQEVQKQAEQEKRNANPYWDYTFSQLYELFYESKYNSGKELSKASERSTNAAYKNCSALHDKIFRDLTYDDLQNNLDACTLKHASLELILSLYHQIYAFAMRYDLVEKDYSQYVYIKKKDDDESGVPFTENEIKKLWENKDNGIAEMLLIMIYSGFRIAEYEKLEVNLDEMYLCGGLKTTAGKGRIVPIHSLIQPLVTKRMERDKVILKYSITKFRNEMYKFLETINIQKHTPHDCRHTFSMLCEKYNVNENDRKRMLGHAFQDVTNKVYGHRSLESLRVEIEKIQKF